MSGATEDVDHSSAAAGRQQFAHDESPGVNGESSDAQHPSQLAQPGRELGSLCSSLQAAADAANNDLRDYLLSHASQRTSIVPLSHELVEMQTAARLYVRRCSVVGNSPGDSSDDTLPRPLLDRLITVVNQAAQLVSDVMGLLESSTRSGASRQQETVSEEQLVARLARTSTTANICTAALNLGLDAIALGPALLPAPAASDATQLPAYQTTQVLEETLSLRMRIANLNSDDPSESPNVIPAVTEFLHQLQSQMGQGSNSLLVPPITETAAESRQSRSDSASLRSDLPQNSSRLLHPGINEAALSGQQSPAYDSVRVEYPAPASINVQHVSRKPFMDGEIFSVAFVSKNGQTYVNANNMVAPTRFLSIRGNNHFVSSYTGGQMTFPPEGAGAPATNWAYVIEDENVTTNIGGATWQHDGTDFRKPVLCIGDYVTNKRYQKLRQWRIRPLCFSPDGSRLAVTSGGRHRLVYLDAAHQFGLRTDEITMTSHTDEITHAMFTPDSHALVTLSRDGTIRLTDAFSMESLGKLDTGTWKKPALLGVTPDSNVVVSVWGDLVYRWNHTTGAVDSYALGSRRVREGWPVALSPDCRFLLCRNEEGVDISDAHSGKVLFTVRFSKGFLTAAAFSADSRYVALGKASSCIGPKVHQSTLDIWAIDF